MPSTFVADFFPPCAAALFSSVMTEVARPPVSALVARIARVMRPTGVPRVAWLVLTLALGATLLLSSLVRISEQRAAGIQVRQLATQSIATVRSRIDVSGQLLRSTAALLMLNRLASRQSWNDYQQQLMHQGLPEGIRQVGYAQRIRKADASSLISTMRADGAPDYRIYPARHKPILMPVLYIAPALPDAARQSGFDLLAAPGAAMALDYATDTGTLALTGAIEPNGADTAVTPKHFLLVLPVFAGGVVPDTVERRRQTVIGFVFAELYLDDAVVMGGSPAPLGLRFFDSALTNAATLLYATPAHGIASTALLIPLEISGHRWTVEATAIQPVSGAKAGWVTAAGVLLSLLLFRLTQVLATSRSREGELVQSKAREVKMLQTQLSALLELDDRAVIIIDRHQRITTFNPGAERIFRVSATEVIGTALTRFLPHGLKNAQFVEVRALRTTRVAIHRVCNRDLHLARRDDGDRFPFEASVFKTGRWGQSCYVLLLSELLPELKAETVQPSVSTVVVSTPTPTAPHSPNSPTATIPTDFSLTLPISVSRFGHFEISVPADPREARIEWSSGVITLLGCRPDIGAVSVARFIETRLHVDDRAIVQQTMEHAFSTGSTANCVYRMMLPDGSIRHVRQWTALAAEQGGIRIFVGALYDCPAQPPGSDDLECAVVSAAEGEIYGVAQVAPNPAALSYTQMQRSPLQNQISTFDFAREEQQKRLAQEMHDDFGQLLAAMKMDLCALQGQLARVDCTLVRKLVGINDLVDAMVGSVRRIMADLPPKLIDEHGFFKAVELLVDTYGKRHRMACQLNLPSPHPAIDELVATPAYRLVQEALNNIAKHANASEVVIRIVCQCDQLILTIADDGVGIALDARKKPGSFGLVGMQERVTALGGAMQIDSSAGNGTAICIVIPLERSTV